MPLVQSCFERLKNDIAWLVLNARNFIEDDIPLLVHLHLGKHTLKRDVRQQLQGTLGVFAALRGRDPGVLLGGVGVDFAAHRFHPVQDVKRLALVRPLEEHMLNEMGQPRFPIPLVSRACIDHKGTMGHFPRHPSMNDAQAVGQNVGLEFWIHHAKVGGKTNRGALARTLRPNMTKMPASLRPPRPSPAACTARCRVRTVR